MWFALLCASSKHSPYTFIKKWRKWEHISGHTQAHPFKPPASLLLGLNGGNNNEKAVFHTVLIAPSACCCPWPHWLLLGYNGHTTKFGKLPLRKDWGNCTTQLLQLANSLKILIWTYTYMYILVKNQLEFCREKPCSRISLMSWRVSKHRGNSDLPQRESPFPKTTEKIPYQSCGRSQEGKNYKGKSYLTLHNQLKDRKESVNIQPFFTMEEGYQLGLTRICVVTLVEVIWIMEWMVQWQSLLTKKKKKSQSKSSCKELQKHVVNSECATEVKGYFILI